MKKKISIFLALIMFFSITIIPVKKAYALKSTYSSQTEFEEALKAEGISTKSFKRYLPVNLAYYNDPQIHRIIYGSVSDIPGSVQIYSKINGEPKYLGFSYDEQPCINPKYPPDVSPVGSAENWHYLIIDEADKSWKNGNLSDEQLKYNTTATFKPKYGATTLSAVKIGLNKVRLQNPATLLSEGSVEVKHNDGGLRWATFEIPAMTYDLNLSGKVISLKSDFKINSKDTGVEIPVDFKAQISGSNLKPSYIKRLEIKGTNVQINSDKTKDISNIYNQTSDCTSISTNRTINIPISDLHKGENTITINGKASYTSYFGDNGNVNLTPAQVKVTVLDDGSDSGVYISASTNPDQTVTGGVVPVKVIVSGGTSSSKAVKNMQLFSKKVNDSSWQNGHIETKNKKTSDTFTFDIYTNDKAFTQVFDVKIIVNYEDGSSETATATASTLFKKSGFTPPKDIPVSELNLPPIAFISAKSPVIMGDDVNITGRGSDPENDPLTYDWSVPDTGMNGYISDTGGTVWFDKTGYFDFFLTVTDIKQQSDTAYRTINVLPPIPKIQLETSGTLKENRKVVMDISKTYGGSKRYPIDWSKTKWKITPITSGVTENDIKSLDSFTGSQKLNLLFKKAGQYHVEISVTNTARYLGYKDIFIDIKPDLAPIADFYTEKTVIRDPKDQNYATMKIYDNSYSEDEDIIAKRVWMYAFDSNNDGDFDNEVWYVYDNGNWRKVGNNYSEAKKVDIDSINDGNKTEVKIRSNHVGVYQIELIVREEFGQETIKDFITVKDKRKDNTFN